MIKRMPMMFMGLMFIVIGIAAATLEQWHLIVLGLALLASGVGAIQKKMVTKRDFKAPMGWASLLLVAVSLLLGISLLFGDYTLPVVGIRVNTDLGLTAGVIILLIAFITGEGR